jgi:hypothetical protein
MRAGERENCENIVVETVSVAGVVLESVANVVKIKSFPMGSGAASKGWKPAIGTGHGGARAKTTQAQTCFSICVRENRKSFKGLAGEYSRGECPRPGAATRCFIARRRIAGRLHFSHAINIQGVPGCCARSQSRMQKRAAFRINSWSKGRVTGWETQVVALRPKK